MYFDVDLDKCSSCGACAMACMDQNDIDLTAGDLPFRKVFPVERFHSDKAVFMLDSLNFYSVACMHCDDAPCVNACPAGCLYKDPETGFTLYDTTGCIGCHSCAMACPFGAPAFRADGKMQKCDGCIERVRRGMTPACVRVCPTGALRLVDSPEKEVRGTSLKKIADGLSV